MQRQWPNNRQGICQKHWAVSTWCNKWSLKNAVNGKSVSNIKKNFKSLKDSDDKCLTGAISANEKFMSGFGTEGIIKQCSNSFLQKHKEDSSKTMNTLHKHYRFVYPLANKFKLMKVVQGCHFLTLYPKSKTEIFYLFT